MADKAQPINVQCRVEWGPGISDAHWTDYGSTTFISAATQHAERMNEPALRVQVRDANDLMRPVASFEVKRRVEFIVTNPRQGAE